MIPRPNEASVLGSKRANQPASQYQRGPWLAGLLFTPSNLTTLVHISLTQRASSYPLLLLPLPAATCLLLPSLLSLLFSLHFC